MLPIMSAASGNRGFWSGRTAAACEIVNGTRAILTALSPRKDDQLWLRPGIGVARESGIGSPEPLGVWPAGKTQALSAHAACAEASSVRFTASMPSVII